VILLAAAFTTWLSVVAAVGAAVAAVAAVIALRYAGQTVRESNEAREDVAVQHAEQMGRMKALNDGMRAATAATAKQEQTDTVHRQVAQIHRLAELLLQTREAADAEAKHPRPDGAPSRLPLMLQTIETAKNAWLVTADLSPSASPPAADLLTDLPSPMDWRNPRDVSDKCASALETINTGLSQALLKGRLPTLVQMKRTTDSIAEAAGNLQGYLLKLLASEGPKTEDELIAAVHGVPSLEQAIPGWVANASKNGLIDPVVPRGGVIEHWQITNDGREVSGIPTEPPH
jgi:hypothetical protein